MRAGPGGAVGDVLSACDVLNEVNVMGVVLLLVHALTGCTLPLKLSPFGRACEDDI